MNHQIIEMNKTKEDVNIVNTALDALKITSLDVESQISQLYEMKKDVNSIKELAHTQDQRVKVSNKY